MAKEKKNLIECELGEEKKLVVVDLYNKREDR